jgi:nucleotide-binding universal stress UspA family protein
LTRRDGNSKGADLIAMGTHGRSGLAKLFVGRVAARVGATAPCAVLTIRSAAGTDDAMTTATPAMRAEI